jgi:hypothetical protein
MPLPHTIITVLLFAIDKNTLVCDGGFFRFAIASSVERHRQKTDVCARRLVASMLPSNAHSPLLVAEHRTQGTREAA